MKVKPRKVLITGATGYVGSRLLTLLQDKNYEIRCMARKPEYLKSKVSEKIKVVRGDVLEPESLFWYAHIHSMR